MAEKKNWIKSAIKNPGALTKQAESKGKTVKQMISAVDKSPEKYSSTTKKRVSLAKTLMKMSKSKK